MSNPGYTDGERRPNGHLPITDRHLYSHPCQYHDLYVVRGFLQKGWLGQTDPVETKGFYNTHLHAAQLGGVVENGLDAGVELAVVIRLDVEHKIGVGHAHVALEGQVEGAEEGDRNAAKGDCAPHTRAVLSVARRAHAKHAPPHIRFRLLHARTSSLDG